MDDILLTRTRVRLKQDIYRDKVKKSSFCKSVDLQLFSRSATSEEVYRFVNGLVSEPSFYLYVILGLSLL